LTTYGHHRSAAQARAVSNSPAQRVARWTAPIRPVIRSSPVWSVITSPRATTTTMPA